MEKMFTDLDQLVERRLIVLRIQRLAADPDVEDAITRFLNRYRRYYVSRCDGGANVYDELTWFHNAEVNGWQLSDMVVEVARLFSNFRGRHRRKPVYETEFSSTRPAWMGAHMSTFPDELVQLSTAFVRWAREVLHDLAWRAEPNMLRSPGLLLQDAEPGWGLNYSWRKLAVIEVFPKLIFAVRKLDQVRRSSAYRLTKPLLRDYLVAMAKLDAYKKASSDMLMQRDKEKDTRHAFALLYALRDSLDDIRPILSADPRVLYAKKRAFRQIIGEVLVGKMEYFSPSDAVLQLMHSYSLGAIAKHHPHVIRFEDYRWVHDKLLLLM